MHHLRRTLTLVAVLLFACLVIPFQSFADDSDPPYETFDLPSVDDLPTVPTRGRETIAATWSPNPENAEPPSGSEDIFLGIGAALTVLACVICIPIIIYDQCKRHTLRSSPRPSQNVVPSAGRTPSPIPSPESVTVPAPASPITPAVERPLNPSPTTSPAEKVSRAIWKAADIYAQEIGAELSVSQFMYLWASFFYVVTKCVGDQVFINSIYSHFDKHAQSYILDPERHFHMVDNMRASYRFMRSHLIVTNIDPTQEDGFDKLWQTIAPVIHGCNHFPEAGCRKFKSISSSLANFARKEYQVKKSTHRIQYSIGGTGDALATTELPN